MGSLLSTEQLMTVDLFLSGFFAASLIAAPQALCSMYFAEPLSPREVLLSRYFGGAILAVVVNNAMSRGGDGAAKKRALMAHGITWAGAVVGQLGSWGLMYDFVEVPFVLFAAAMAAVNLSAALS
jgi:hypothetical protein